MRHISKWYVRFLISLVLAVIINMLSDNSPDARGGGINPAFSAFILYILLSIIYGLSSHNQKLQKEKSENILDD
ncbi:MAG: hypothetical protein IPM77_06910 [Crocinitomicaceae bacterium]|nr:hypothetical protein [Crocinitomicaceae bacterium]